MKARLTDYFLLVLLLLVVGCWIIQGASVENLIKVLPMMAAIASAYVAIRHFRLKTTLDKVQAITLAPTASEHIVRVLKYIDKTNSNEETINRDSIESDDKLFTSVIFLLGFSDDLAVAILKGIVDEAITREMIGSFIIRMFNNLRTYIEEVDELRGIQCYPNLTMLSLKWNV